ncbi:cytochrome c oxidase subunit III [Oscillochloris trichoides DG-6]|uniref:Cytochrome c oxidase subunit III n=1 Tax=Oscillochloris trichoides DG-6 TaxID=765420 RepID=E1IGZ8_9CHLR|nr:cytochrome c oxidase subunit 3 [Oscillochloris trichoides]EFO79473.1 cytochrome c oxidase subunit III [Oscillochloris trichoides DG-6]
MATTSHEHGHNPALQHHFDTPEQQREAATLGMWAFLTTEIMLFGGIFMAYAVYRWAYHEVWALAATHLNTPLAAINTVVLLVSSLTVALGVHAAASGKQRQVVLLLLVTILLGAAFLGIKVTEYSEKFAHCAGYANPITWISGGATLEEAECLVPGQQFHFPVGHGAEEASSLPNIQRNAQLFYLLYFCATGLHAIHMIVGISIMAVLAWMAARGRFSSEYYTPVEIGGLYWHLIDIIWVFLFPLFYLV